jgi:hypothetical protein
LTLETPTLSIENLDILVCNGSDEFPEAACRLPLSTCFSFSSPPILYLYPSTLPDTVLEIAQPTARRIALDRPLHLCTGVWTTALRLQGRLFTYLCCSLLFTSACASSIMSGNSFNDLPGYIVDATGTYTYNASAITSEQMSAPITIMAIIYPIISAPACILCLAPMVWHFRQANIAAGSLIAWILFHNFFNSINPLIWPRDNLLEWWNGQIWCDVQVRFQVGSYVGLTASLTLVLRKLAHVLDTRNITVSTSHGSKVKAKVWEVFWCWIVPFIFMAVYYVVQSVRYAIIGIAGCWSLHDGSWPSMVLGFMWSAVGILFATYWACKFHLLPHSTSPY